MARTASLLVGVCALTAIAQERAGLPSADQVIDRYIQALGGRTALQSVSSRAGMGSLHSPTSGAWGGYMEVYQPPNRLLRAFQVQNYGVVQICFDGSTAWMETPEYGVESLNGKRLAEARRDAEFEGAVNLREIYSTLVVKGKTKIEDRDAYELLAKCPDGTSETLMFDVDNSLLICRHSMETARDGSSRLIRTFYEDYNETGGIRLPQTMRYVRDDLIRIMRRNIVINVPVDASRFRKP